ncbi:MAG: D-alanyl-D-alanine carboxypeptidase family protein [Clostridia bacterium]|nr:D-alanyl-D-alanine carboxypeptidase family protein [Clostridia bacterium]
MRARRCIAALLAAALLWPLSGAARAEEPSVNASGAALFIADGARLIYGLNENARLPMASTTKIMTALLALESCALDEMAEVPDEAVGVEGSSVYLARGETMSMRDLLYGLMLTSGNDAAVTIAVHVAGSVEAFAERMNERARALGCTDTHFVTPNGLHDDEHYTSARDLGLIACEAMKNEDFRTIVSTEYYETRTGDHARTFKNKNKTLWQYEGGCGVKTGFTKAAGRCLVFSAERAGVLIVGVVLNCPNMWEDAFALLDAGFDMTERRRLVAAEQPLASLPVEKSEVKALAVYPKNDILGTLKADGSEEIGWELRLPDALVAPVEAGTEVGALRLIVDGRTLSETPLIVAQGAALRTPGEWWRRVLEAFVA